MSRQAEREAIVEVLRSVEQQRAPAVLELVGEAGIGKTTLLETVQESPRVGRLVLRGRAAEFEGDLPYGLFIDALDAYLARLGERPSGGLDPDELAELAGVFPALERRVAAPAVLVREERFRFHRAVRSLLEQVGSRGSAVLALDDVHFADPSSCELLASLLRRPPDGPVLLALAYRSGRGPPAVTSELIAAARSGRVERIELGPLSRTDSEALMAAEGLGATERERLFALSGGNPFYLDRLVRASQRTDAGSAARELAPVADTDSETPIIPAEVAVVLAQEVGALRATAQAVVQGAAVAGEPFEPDLVAEIAGVGESEVLLALDELQDHDLIRPTAMAREFRFRHPLVRAAVYRSLKGGWRVSAHARAAAALARRGAPAMVVAPHLEQSARAGDRDAIGVLAEAGRAAAGRAPASAARWLAAAVRLAPAHGAGSELRLELMPELAGALASVGALERCHEVVVEALAMLPETIDERRTALIAGCAQAEIFLGRYDQARARLVKALDSVGDELTPVRVGLQLALASCASYANELDLAVFSARSALDGARQLGRPRLHAGALSILSLCAYAAGNLDEAEAAYTDASALIAALEDDTIERHVELLWFLGWAGWFLGHYTAAEAHFRRGIAISRTTDARLLTEMTVGRAITLTWLGRLEEAVASSQDALEAARLNNNPSRLMWCNIACCHALTAAGELEAAIAAAEDAVGIARQLGTSVISAAAGWACAAALIEAGQPGRAVEVMLEMLGGPDLPHYYAGMKPLCYGLLTRAEIQRGDGAAARDWADRATASAQQVGSALGQAHAGLARAAASLAAEPAVASELALRSAETFDRTGGVLDAARARLLAGRALTAVRDRERAGDELRRAEESFARFGATRLRAEAVRELRRIGRRVSSTGRRGAVDGGPLASLSRREQEVADLVTARLTNREIAARLFLSEKTVESHLSSVFVKLAVRSRAEVARAVETARSEAGTPRTARSLTPPGP